MIDSFLPEELSEVELRNIIEDVLKTEEVISMKSMKKLMTEIPNRTTKIFDKSKISGILKEHI